MSSVIGKLALAFLLLNAIKGNCSDSAYIFIRYGWAVDKPHNEFIFYKKGSHKPDVETFREESFFILKIEVPVKTFNQLKEQLFMQYDHLDSSEKTNYITRWYTIEYFEGLKLLGTRPMKVKQDYFRVYKILSELFKETEYEKQLEFRWEAIIARLGVKSN